MRSRYNKADAVARYTVQVYPNTWSAILVSLDNKGMELEVVDLAEAIPRTATISYEY